MYSPLLIERVAHERAVEGIRAQCGADIAAVAWAAGQGLTLEQIIAEVPDLLGEGALETVGQSLLVDVESLVPEAASASARTSQVASVTCRRCGSVNLRKSGRTKDGRPQIYCRDCNFYCTLDTLAASRAQQRTLVEQLRAEGVWQSERVSSAVERWHCILRPHLAVRRSLTSGMLALLAVWHNHRVFSRGVHKGKSPLHLSGMTDAPSDWLIALGYPPVEQPISAAHAGVLALAA